MKKVISILLVLSVIGYLAFSYFMTRPTSEPPSVAKAPFQVQTYSRTYYAQKVEGKSPDITMTNYYQMMNDRWTLTKRSITLNRNFGIVTVKDRR